MTIAAVAVGCGGGDDGEVDREGYVQENVALLETIPIFPGTRRGKVTSHGYTEDEQSDMIAGYGTSRTDALPAGTRPSAAIEFYRRVLRRNWQVVGLFPRASAISLRKGDAYLHLFAGGGVVDVEVDHDCYKGGSSPVCFGP